MSIIRQAFEVDLFVDPKPLSEKERKMISDFIKADKEKSKLKKQTEKTYSVNRVRRPE